MKMAIIGGGSSYTPELFEGIIQRSEVLPIREVVLVDVPEGRKKTEIILGLGKRMFKKAGVPVDLWMTQNRRQALEGASFVINQIRVGQLDARILDEQVPLRYGMIGQETTGAGGFAKALRTIPVALEIAEDMSRSCPEGWLINFANPAGIVTEALLRNTGIRTVGLCNVPINMHNQLAKALELTPDDLYCEFVGLNHLSFIRGVRYQGRQIMERILDFQFSGQQTVANIPSADDGGELIKELGLIPSPYLNYYYREEQMLAEEQEAMESGKGTRGEQVKAIEEALFQKYADESLDKKPEELSKRGGAFYSQAALSLMESLCDPVGKVHVVNTVNLGSVPDLPFDSVIETNAWVSQFGIFPLAGGPLPIQVKGLVQQIKTYEELTVAAATVGSKKLAMQALLAHPLVHGFKNAHDVLEDLFQAHRRYLPQFYKQS